MSRKPALPAAPIGTASINVRLSKEAGVLNLSKEGMTDDCKALAERLGLTVIAVHVDDGASGAIRNRPGFVRWLDDARHCRADTLIAWHVDRMTREGVNVAGQILDIVEGKDPNTGKVVRQPVRLLDTKGLDSDPGPGGDDSAFRFKFLFAAEIARAERQRMKDRSSHARRRAVSAGRWPGGPPPFGFRTIGNPDGPGKVLEIVEREAAFIREATARLLAGESLCSVVRFANGPDGHAPRRAKHWWRRTLVQTLTGYPVAGRVVRFEEGIAVPVLDGDGQPLTLPAILTPDESAAVRRVLAPGPNISKGGRAPARLLSGLLRCGSCGRLLRVTNRGGPRPAESGAERSRVYRCVVGREAADCPRPVGIAADGVEQYVTDVFLATWGASPAFTRRAEVTGAAAVEEAKARLDEAFAKLAATTTHENFLRVQEAKTLHEAALAAPSEAVVRAVPTGRTIGQTWEQVETPDRRSLLATNYAEIIVRPGKRGPVVDPTRIVLVAQPPFAADHQDAAGFRPGTVVV